MLEGEPEELYPFRVLRAGMMMLERIVLVIIDKFAPIPVFNRREHADHLHGIPAADAALNCALSLLLRDDHPPGCRLGFLRLRCGKIRRTH